MVVELASDVPVQYDGEATSKWLCELQISTRRAAALATAEQLAAQAAGHAKQLSALRDAHAKALEALREEVQEWQSRWKVASALEVMHKQSLDDQRNRSEAASPLREPNWQPEHAECTTPPRTPPRTPARSRGFVPMQSRLAGGTPGGQATPGRAGGTPRRTPNRPMPALKAELRTEIKAELREEIGRAIEEELRREIGEEMRAKAQVVVDVEALAAADPQAAAEAQAAACAQAVADAKAAAAVQATIDAQAAAEAQAAACAQAVADATAASAVQAAADAPALRAKLRAEIKADLREESSAAIAEELRSDIEQEMRAYANSKSSLAERPRDDEENKENGRFPPPSHQRREPGTAPLRSKKGRKAPSPTREVTSHEAASVAKGASARMLTAETQGATVAAACGEIDSSETYGKLACAQPLPPPSRVALIKALVLVPFIAMILLLFTMSLWPAAIPTTIGAVSATAAVGNPVVKLVATATAGVANTNATAAAITAATSATATTTATTTAISTTVDAPTITTPTVIALVAAAATAVVAPTITALVATLATAAANTAAAAEELLKRAPVTVQPYPAAGSSGRSRKTLLPQKILSWAAGLKHHMTHMKRIHYSSTI